MKNKKITINEAKNIALDAFFEGIGLKLSKVCNDGADKWYLSPFREEKTASLHLSVANNIWFDFGKENGLKGGSIIDFCLEYFSPTSISEILEKLNIDFFSFQPQEITIAKTQKKGIKLVDIEELTDLNLINYLQDRGIKKEIGQKYCQQIGYVNANKYFKSVGFQNVAGGYEIRGKGFKSCVAPKTISFIDNGQSKLSIFEGFMDFLSYLMLPEFEVKDCNYLILNSLSFINQIDEVIGNHRQIFLFLDTDNAGEEATQKLKKYYPNIINVAVFYSNFKDLNDYLLWKSP